MKTTEKENEECCPKFKHMHHHRDGASGAVYGLGFVGALIYFLQHAHTLVEGLMGILKAMVWPALFVYKLLEILKL